MSQETKWSILLRGDSEVAEVVLCDEHGRRASRQCTDGRQIITLLHGWEREYGCEAWLFFLIALDTVRPPLCFTLLDWSERLLRGQRPRFLSPDAARRLLELARRPYRPRDIRDLKREIERDFQAAERYACETGMIDDDQVDAIAAKRLQLDGFYGAWAEGQLN